jgi:molybdopterin converting factor small subunit
MSAIPAAHPPASPDVPEHSANGNGTAAITVVNKLPWREKTSCSLVLPQGTRVESLLPLMGEEADNVLIVRNNHMCENHEKLRSGDVVQLLPMLSGG